MLDDIQILITKRLSFLLTEYNFNQPKIYNLAYENHIEYRKDNFSIDVGTELYSLLPFGIKTYKDNNSDESLNYFIITQIIPIEEYTKRLEQICIVELPEEIIPERKLLFSQKSKIQKLIDLDKELRLNIELLLENKEILNGDFLNFSSTYKFKKHIKEKFKSLF